ncbi:hypothetical protein GCK72_017190 [Caenorhabditis remanei]|uniref:Uncharacterized protein n=1 Tax=Caenorhabditis remanei TaxID=31234 RepID=A0A6A5G820_CAERE|nr:hypothetical protein GCK72_017190 [Caenorhabditis remanei]KAF1750639.1 hypothetical protein GCK72_017190 [Caenorhabditis remanei]
MTSFLPAGSCLLDNHTTTAIRFFENKCLKMLPAALTILLIQLLIGLAQSVAMIMGGHHSKGPAPPISWFFLIMFFFCLAVGLMLAIGCCCNKKLRAEYCGGKKSQDIQRSVQYTV